MSAKAGERAQKTGDFYRASCDEKVHVTEGGKMPECPNGPRAGEQVLRPSDRADDPDPQNSDERSTGGLPRATPPTTGRSVTGSRTMTAGR